MDGGPGVEWRSVRGTPVPAADCTVTPVATSLVARWPGGAFVWSRPAAVVVEWEGRARRVPVRDLSTRIVWAIRVGAAALVVACILRDRGRRTSDD